MSKFLKIATLLLIMTSGVTSALAQDHHYLPLLPGNEWWYVNTGNPSLTIHSFFEEGPDGASIFNSETLLNGEVVSNVRGLFSSTEEGDINFLAVDMGGSWVPFTLPYVQIDAPLFTGKTWSFESAHPVFGLIDFTAEVVAEELVTVPGVGTLYCYKVHFEEVWENFGSLVSDRWFADGFGEVKLLDQGMAPDPFIVTAGNVVQTERNTWDELKALYR
jgi:hypothetical protein